MPNLLVLLNKPCSAVALRSILRSALFCVLLSTPTPYKRVNILRINPLAVLVAPATVVPRQNRVGTTLAGAAPVMAVN